MSSSPPSAARSRSHRRRRGLSTLVWLAVLALGGCHQAATTVPLRGDQRPVAIGRGPRFQLPAISSAVARGAPVAGLRCETAERDAYGVHVELFASRRVLIVPAGIGVAPPQRRQGAYVLGGRCSYPAETLEPTGVIVVERGRQVSLGALFALWGQRLSAEALAGFHGRVAAFVDGRRWFGPPAAIPLRPHEEIVLEIGGHVPPHPAYTFAPGL